MPDKVYIAVDLGAGSGRVFVGAFGDRFDLSEVHRFTYPPVHRDGHLRWDFELIFSEIIAGLRLAAEFARDQDLEVVSIGVDTWAVDYGLLDADGKLLGDPVCYRDERTSGAMARVFAEIMPREDLFKLTGIQFLPFNSIFQLASDASVSAARHFLLMPDLINFKLTGERRGEWTNTTTTQLIDASRRECNPELLSRLGVSPTIFAPIVEPGTLIGPLLPEIAGATTLGGAMVVAPATHDTGSAVAGAPLRAGEAYISSGTWSLVGLELDQPLINADVANFNFTNEGGVYGSVRFLKNVMGLWILESCRREWQAEGVQTSYDQLFAEAAALPSPGVAIFPDDERFLNPPSMVAAINAQLRETGQREISRQAELTRVILDSLALRYASVLRTATELTKIQLTGLRVIGGGSRNQYLNQATADATGLTVKAGPVEATVIGNLVVQAITDGRFTDLRSARDFVAEHTPAESFLPRRRADYLPVEVYERLEARFSTAAAAG